MKTFFVARKSYYSVMAPSRMMAVSPADAHRHADRASVRKILRGPWIQTQQTVATPEDVDALGADGVLPKILRMPESPRWAEDASGGREAQPIVMGRNTRQASQSEGADPTLSREAADKTLVNGFRIDNRYCFCDVQIEKELEWVGFMADLFRECKREVKDGTALDAIACKTKKLDEAGIKTVLVGSVDRKGDVQVDDWPGPCGSIFQHGVRLHEAVHRDYIAHGRTPVVEMTRRGPKNQKELRDLAEVSAREYSANEVKAYNHEAKYLQKVLEALRERCSPGDFLTTDPQFYERACGELGLDMGLDFPPGAGWSRRDIEDSWPGLKGKCWWFLDRVAGGGYNCYGHCFRDEEGLQIEEPSLEAGETYEGYFRSHGYEETSGTGDIALYSESHVARRSQHTFRGKQLWESKLGSGGPLILHQLKDLEGGLYGRVVAYYSRVNR